MAPAADCLRFHWSSLPPACPCWWQLSWCIHIREKLLEFSSVVLPLPSLYLVGWRVAWVRKSVLHHSSQYPHFTTATLFILVIYMCFRRGRWEEVDSDCGLDWNQPDDSAPNYLPHDSVQSRLWGVCSQTHQDANETRTGSKNLCLLRIRRCGSIVAKN